MTKSIAILGCGWLGERIGKALMREGWTVFASSRKEIRLKELVGFGFQAFQIDLEDSSNIPLEFFNADYLIIATTNKNNLAHENLLKIVAKSRVKNTFFISSTSVYQKSTNQITVNTPLINSPLIEVEKKYLASKKTYILRCGGLIGDNRKPGNFFKKGATIKNPDGIVNLIHFEEVIKTIKSLIEQTSEHKVHNLIQNSHESRFVFYSRAYREMHGESSEFHRMIL